LILHICFISLTVNTDNSIQIKKSLALTNLSDSHLLQLNNQANILTILWYYTDAIKIYQQSLTLANNSPVLYATILANIL